MQFPSFSSGLIYGPVHSLHLSHIDLFMRKPTKIKIKNFNVSLSLKKHYFYFRHFFSRKKTHPWDKCRFKKKIEFNKFAKNFYILHISLHVGPK